MSDVRHWILVIENDPEIREEVLIPGLQNAGFHAVGVGTAVDAYRCMLARNFSLFVLDSDLPDANGLPLADRLRTVTDAGIVVLTEHRPRKGRQTRAANDGADACVARPVDVAALVATLQSLLRRLKPLGIPGIANKRPSSWRLGTAGWDLISPGGAKVQLTQPERLVIGTLAASSGKVVARDAILSHLASDAKNYGRHRLEMLVHRLRRKVLSTTKEQLPLKAVRGVGYVLFL